MAAMHSQFADDSSTETVVSVRDLRVRYGEREILHGINFEVKHGETMVIMGGSGSGKSTLLRALVGLEKPSRRQIWLKGKDIATISEAELDEIRKQIGMSFQGGALFGSMSVRDNVALPSANIPPRGIHDRNHDSPEAPARRPYGL